MKRLVKIDSKGKVRLLEIWTEGGRLNRAAGLLDGKLVLSHVDVQPKNVGKANETTVEEQAISEMNSEVAKKQNETYVLLADDIDPRMYTDEEVRGWIDAGAKSIPKAMLAKTYDAKYADYESGVLVSPKLDGMRCLSPVAEMWSRGGKEIETMHHIKENLAELRELTGFQGTFDGELYVHAEDEENFEEIMQACKKYRKGISEKVEYWVYDIVDDKLTALERASLYAGVLHLWDGPIKAVPQYLVHNEDEMRKLHKKNISSGYEGSMCKNAESLYRENARSSDLLKVKDFQDAEYKVVDIIPMKNKPEFGIALLEDPVNGRFKATPKMSHEQRRKLLEDREEYIGATATVEFFSFTGKGLPRFPVLKAITKKGDLEDFRVIK